MYSKIVKLFHSPGPKYKTSETLLYIALSCLISLAFFLNTYKSLIPFYKSGPIENINLVYENPSEELPSDFFCNLLSLDNENTHILDTKTLEKKLLSTGMFRHIKIKKNFYFNMITVKYGLKHPIAFLGNKTFQGIDHLGIYFPILPRFLSRKLPEIYIPPSQDFSLNMSSEYLDRTKEIMSHLSPEIIYRIDLSYMDEYPYEIIVTLRDQSIILLTAFDLPYKITAYKKLRNYLNYHSNINLPLVYDLRFKRYALVSVKTPL